MSIQLTVVRVLRVRETEGKSRGRPAVTTIRQTFIKFKISLMAHASP